MRDSLINRSVITDKYPIYPEIETWQHAMICEKNEDLRIEYITNLKKGLMKIESYQEDSNEIEIIVNNIEAFLQ